MRQIWTNSAEDRARIIVVGVGDAGSQAVNRMIDEEMDIAEFIGVNTDKQALQQCKAPKLLQIGEKLTQGLETEASPEVGGKAAEESAEDISAALRGADLVFVVCGLGGGTGTGAAPVVAKLAKDMGILTVGIVTTPFSFEEEERLACAGQGTERLEACVNTLIVFEGDRLLQSMDKDVSRSDAFEEMRRVLWQTVQGITDMLHKSDIIDLDYADLEMVMRPEGIAHVGIGAGQGENNALDAVQIAMEGLMGEMSPIDAAHIIIYVSGDVSLVKVSDAAGYVQKMVGGEDEILLGLHFDNSAADCCTVMVIVKTRS